MNITLLINKTSLILFNFWPFALAYITNIFVKIYREEANLTYALLVQKIKEQKIQEEWNINTDQITKQIEELASKHLMSSISNIFLHVINISLIIVTIIHLLIFIPIVLFI